MMDQDALLSDLCRPKSLDDLNLPDKEIAFLKAMAKNKRHIKNLLFSGKPGIGKTSAALILIQNMDFSSSVYNERTVRGLSFKSFMEDYFGSRSFDGNFKTLIINEADTLKKTDQVYLLDAIERLSDNGRFIMTANVPRKMIDPLKSRLTHISFDIRPTDRQAVIEKMIKRYVQILHDNGRPIDQDVISKIVHIYFPDLRTVANELEREIMSHNA
jgi:DNA polymerase III delta prime subunit